MSPNGFLVYPTPEPVRQALAEHFSTYKDVTHKEISSLVSVRCVADFIRQTVPDCTLGDDELNNIIVEHAILLGFNLHFDCDVPKIKTEG